MEGSFDNDITNGLEKIRSNTAKSPEGKIYERLYHHNQEFLTLKQEYLTPLVLAGVKNKGSYYVGGSNLKHNDRKQIKKANKDVSAQKLEHGREEEYDDISEGGERGGTALADDWQHIKKLDFENKALTRFIINDRINGGGVGGERSIVNNGKCKIGEGKCSEHNDGDGGDDDDNGEDDSNYETERKKNETKKNSDVSWEKRNKLDEIKTRNTKVMQSMSGHRKQQRMSRHLNQAKGHKEEAEQGELKYFHVQDLSLSRNFLTEQKIRLVSPSKKVAIKARNIDLSFNKIHQLTPAFTLQLAAYFEHGPNDHKMQKMYKYTEEIDIVKSPNETSESYTNYDSHIGNYEHRTNRYYSDSNTNKDYKDQHEGSFKATDADVSDLKAVELRSLNLSHNVVEEILEGTFHQKEAFNNLQHIDLSFNKLVSLRNCSFINLQSLRTLNLSHNFLTTIHPFAFTSVLEGFSSGPSDGSASDQIGEDYGGVMNDLDHICTNLPSINTADESHDDDDIDGGYNDDVLSASSDDEIYSNAESDGKNRKRKIEQVNQEYQKDYNDDGNRKENSAEDTSSDVYEPPKLATASFISRPHYCSRHQWPRLQMVDLSHNHLKNLEEAIFRGALCVVKHLRLNHNHLEHLPRWVCVLEGLQWMD